MISNNLTRIALSIANTLKCYYINLVCFHNFSLKSTYIEYLHCILSSLFPIVFCSVSSNTCQVVRTINKPFSGYALPTLVLDVVKNKLHLQKQFARDHKTNTTNYLTSQVSFKLRREETVSFSVFVIALGIVRVTNKNNRTFAICKRKTIKIR